MLQQLQSRTETTKIPTNKSMILLYSRFDRSPGFLYLDQTSFSLKLNE